MALQLQSQVVPGYQNTKIAAGNSDFASNTISRSGGKLQIWLILPMLFNFLLENIPQLNEAFGKPHREEIFEMAMKGKQGGN